MAMAYGFQLVHPAVRRSVLQQDVRRARRRGDPAAVVLPVRRRLPHRRGDQQRDRLLPSCRQAKKTARTRLAHLHRPRQLERFKRQSNACRSVTAHAGAATKHLGRRARSYVRQPRYFVAALLSDDRFHFTSMPRYPISAAVRAEVDRVAGRRPGGQVVERVVHRHRAEVAAVGVDDVDVRLHTTAGTPGAYWRCSPRALRRSAPGACRRGSRRGRVR